MSSMHICILFCDVVMFEIASASLFLSQWQLAIFKDNNGSVIIVLKAAITDKLRFKSIIIRFSQDNFVRFYRMLRTDVCVLWRAFFDCIHRKKEISCFENIFNFNKISWKSWNDEIFSKQEIYFFSQRC